MAAEDFSRELAGDRNRERYLSAELTDEGGRHIWRDTTWFVQYKKIDLPDPELKAGLKQAAEGYEITLTAKRYAAFVELDLYEGDAVFSDNYFDMDAGEERRITLYWNSPEELSEKKLKIRTLRDSYR